MTPANDNLPPLTVELSAPTLADLQNMVATLQRELEPGTEPYVWTARYVTTTKLKRAYLKKTRRPARGSEAERD
jgi:hypothetical protein